MFLIFKPFTSQIIRIVLKQRAELPQQAYGVGIASTNCQLSISIASLFIHYAGQYSTNCKILLKHDFIKKICCQYIIFRRYPLVITKDAFALWFALVTDKHFTK